MARTRGCFLNGEKITCCWDKWPRFVIAAFSPAFPSTVVRGGEYGVVNSEGVGRTEYCFQCLYVHGYVLAKYSVSFVLDGLDVELLCWRKEHWEGLLYLLMFFIISF